jgi:hypothetical protein
MEDTEQQRFEHVSNALKAGFAALAGPEVDDDVKPQWHQRLIAITNSAKHDLATAERRLDNYWADWEDQIGPRPPTDDPTDP